MKYLVALVASMKVLWLGRRIKGDFSIVKVEKSSEGLAVYLPVNADTECLGDLSLFWNSRKGHAIVRRTPSGDSIELRRFEVIANLGEQVKATGDAWISGWLGDQPEHFGFSSVQNLTSMPNGTRAFISEQDSLTWVIHVHGRKATYAETLRNAILFHQHGFSQLAISHLSDSPPNGIGTRRSRLGSAEWTQIAEAIEFAKSKGAEKIILFGWSLGGMMVNQYLSKAAVAKEVVGVILDSPLLDYRSTLKVQAVRAGYHEAMGDLIADTITNSKLLRALGFKNIAVDEISALGKSIPVQLPTVLFYSLNDGYIAMDGVFRYQELNSKVSLKEIPGARHCRLFNEDKESYQRAIEDFLRLNL